MNIMLEFDNTCSLLIQTYVLSLIHDEMKCLSKINSLDVAWFAHNRK